MRDMSQFIEAACHSACDELRLIEHGKQRVAVVRVVGVPSDDLFADGFSALAHEVLLLRVERDAREEVIRRVTPLTSESLL
jgi:hypothetical protein